MVQPCCNACTHRINLLSVSPPQKQAMLFDQTQTKQAPRRLKSNDTLNSTGTNVHHTVKVLHFSYKVLICMQNIFDSLILTIVEYVILVCDHVHYLCFQSAALLHNVPYNLVLIVSLAWYELNPRQCCFWHLTVSSIIADSFLHSRPTSTMLGWKWRIFYAMVMFIQQQIYNLNGCLSFKYRLDYII